MYNVRTQSQTSRAGSADTMYDGTNVLFSHLMKNNIKKASDLLVSVSAHADVHRTKIINLASSASEELQLMAQEREPLWIFDLEKGSETLNVTEYDLRFGLLDPTLEEIIRVIAKDDPLDLLNFNELPSENGSVSAHTTENMDSEASRAIGVVFRNPISLVHMFMDVDKWSATFSNIVSKAINLAVLSAGSHKDSPNGAILVMTAEFHVPCPLVKTRKMYFVRYTRQINTNTWVVADVSLESIFPTPSATCQRKPSGCIIQALQDGLSMVTWVEHNAAVHNGMVHSTLTGLLTSGSAFSAKRWISSLERQYDRIATLEAKNNASISYHIPNKQGFGITARNSLLKLAEKMVRRFNSNICSNMENAWRALGVAGSGEIMIRTRFSVDDPEIPHGVAVTVATSVWVPVKQIDVYNFLQNVNNRNKWDILSDGLKVEEAIRISSARNSTDYVSVFSILGPSWRRGITYLQESFSDSTANYVVYSPVDVPTMDQILQGDSAADSGGIYILPSGFAVIPYEDGKTTVLTVAFEVMDQQQQLTASRELSPQSHFAVYGLMAETLSRIRTALLPKL